MKKIIFILSIVLLSVQFFACKDYVERDIEGQWQLRTVISHSGVEQQVDTVYLAFDRYVFRYLKLLSEDETVSYPGKYSRDGDKLKVMMPGGVQNLPHFDWGVENRTFVIKKHTSSVLEIEADDNKELLILRKY